MHNVEDKVIVKYVKNGKGQAVGCVVAVKDANTKTVGITGSRCHSHKDVYDKQKGVEIAMSRAYALINRSNIIDDGLGTRCAIPASLEAEMNHMHDRAINYFKDIKVFVKSPIVPIHVGMLTDVSSDVESAFDYLSYSDTRCTY